MHGACLNLQLLRCFPVVEVSFVLQLVDEHLKKVASDTKGVSSVYSSLGFGVVLNEMLIS